MVEAFFLFRVYPDAMSVRPASDIRVGHDMIYDQDLSDSKMAVTHNGNSDNLGKTYQARKMEE